MSPPTPLLVLPAWAAAAAGELDGGLPSGGCGVDAASLLSHLGFLLHTTELHQQPGRRPLEAAAAQRTSQLARSLAAHCVGRGWPNTARLLLPAMAVAGGSSGGSSGAVASSSTPSKADASAAPARADILRALKGASAEEQEQVEGLLAQLLQAEAEEEAAEAGAPLVHCPLRDHAAHQLSDWFVNGCNLAVGLASLALLLRSAWDAQA